jgi:hypothetical protein
VEVMVLLVVETLVDVTLVWKVLVRVLKALSVAVSVTVTILVWTAVEKTVVLV